MDSYSLLCKHSSLFVNLVILKCKVRKSSRLREGNLGLGCLSAYCCNLLDYSEIFWKYKVIGVAANYIWSDPI